MSSNTELKVKRWPLMANGYTSKRTVLMPMKLHRSRVTSQARWTLIGYASKPTAFDSPTPRVSVFDVPIIHVFSASSCSCADWFSLSGKGAIRSPRQLP